MLEQIERVAKIAGVIVAIFGIWKYFDLAHQATVDKSLGYFDEFHSGSVFDARVAVGQMSYAWRSVPREDGLPLTAEDITKRALVDFGTVPGVIHYDLIVEFFDRIKKCIEQDSCDKSTAIELFADEARALQVFLTPKIIERQQLRERHAAGLLCMADRYQSQECAADL